MLLRRLTQSLKSQNWTAIWIEFVLLVLGVFLGIQVSNWNAAQQEHVQEAEYIARLQRDFHAIDARLAINLTRWQEKAAAPMRLMVDFDTFQRHGSWPRAQAAMLHDLQETTNGRIPAPRAATYVELLSAGKLGLLRNTRLRDALLDYDEQTSFTMKAYDVLVQRTDPHMATIVAHMEVDRNIITRSITEQAKDTGRIEVFADADLAGLSADPGLKVALNMFAVSSSNQLMISLLQQEKARAVTALLDQGAKRGEGNPP